MTFWFYGTFRSYFDIDHHKTNCVFWTISSICHLHFATQCCTHCNVQVQGTLASHLWDRGSFQYLPRTEVTLLNHSGANFWAATPHCQTHSHAKGSCATGTQPLSQQGKTMLEVRCRATSKPDTCQLLKIKLFFWKHSIFPLSPTSSNESSSKPPEKSAWSPQRLYGSQPRCQPHTALPSFWSYWSSDLISPLLICDSRKGQARISLAGNKQLLPPAWPKSPG